MAKHAAVTVATDLPVYFAHPRSPWERPSNENTNGMIREYLPKGVDITDHQPYLDEIAADLNERPPPDPRLPHTPRSLRTTPPRQRCCDDGFTPPTLKSQQ